MLKETGGSGCLVLTLISGQPEVQHDEDYRRAAALDLNERWFFSGRLAFKTRCFRGE